MHYALSPRTFFFSHYFYTGLRIGAGIVGLAAIVTWFTDTTVGVTVATGALCASLMDLPSPLRHKFVEMLSSVLVCSLISLIVELCAPAHQLLGLVIGGVSFAASMLVAFGRKAMPLQFAALFAMLLSENTPTGPGHAAINTVLFFAGGMAYLGYALAVTWILRDRIKQQVLAEALVELARYLKIRAGFYAPETALQQQFQQLVRQQTVLAEKQQAARELVLRGSVRQSRGNLLQVQYAMLDLYECVLSMHADVDALRTAFDGGEVLSSLQRLAAAIASDVESVAYAMARNRPIRSQLEWRAELQILEGGLQQDARPDGSHALLHDTIGKVHDMLHLLQRLHAATFASNLSPPAAHTPRVAPSLTRQRYGLGVIASELRWRSPTFRYAVRVALAVTTGFFAGRIMPYAAYGYWIALTVAVIMKPNFSMTRRRRADRVVGTFLGCILTAAVLHFVHSPTILLALLFVATVAGPTFLYVKYRYTAIAATVQVLILIGLTSPSVAHAVNERLLDTLVGAAIATIFSYVLPSWEFQTIPRLVAQLLRANRAYLVAWRDLLQEKESGDLRYRVARKHFLDSIAALSGAIERMQDEPADKRMTPKEINWFAVQSYLLVAHCAAIRAQVARYRQDASAGEVGDRIGQAWRIADAYLQSAQEALRTAKNGSGTVGAGQSPTLPSKAPIVLAGGPHITPIWPGWAPIDRRIEYLVREAQQLATLTSSLATAFSPTPLGASRGRPLSSGHS
ncbi:MAG TPA: FUSC family membrane protein [Noviherbaspirillum sp.]|nr:FUSC family membrane protein [Noviherbaspirillum sp.]